MNHFTKKNTFAGGGGEPARQKIKAGTLRAPNLGNFDIAGSYSIIEVVDLLCDGPIHSIVNDEGANVTNDHLTQGIYLDNTPVEVTNSQTVVVDLTSALSLKPSNDTKKYYTSDQLNSLVADLKVDKVSISNQTYLFDIPRYNTFCSAEVKATGDNALAGDVKSYEMSIEFPFLKRRSDLDPPNKDNYFYYKPNGNEGGTDLYKKSFNPDSEWDYIIYTPEKKTLPILELDEKNIEYGYYFINNGATTSHTPENITPIALLNREIHYYNQANDSSFDSVNSLYKTFTKNLTQIINGNIVGDLNIPPGYNLKFKQLAQNTLSELQILRKNYFGQNILTRKLPSNKIVMLISIGNVDFTDLPVLTSAQGVVQPHINDILKINIPNFNLTQGEVKVHFIPKVGNDGTLTGGICGLISISINLTETTTQYTSFGTNKSWRFPTEIIEFEKTNLTLYLYKDNSTTSRSSISTAAKFNFSNILCEFKVGEEKQAPLGWFNDIHIDYDYGQSLLGPFRSGGNGVRRFQEDPQIRTSWTVSDYQEIGGFPKLNGNDLESSVDKDRKSKQNYSEWNKGNDFNEDASPVVHTIENPNVTSVYFTLGISSLKDTASADITFNQEATKDGEDPKVASEDEFLVGDTYPAILVIQVEWGKLVGGIADRVGSREYRIVCQIEGQMMIDFGQPTGRASDAKKNRYIRDNKSGGKGKGNANLKTLLLPQITEGENTTLVKRYIKITKVSTETNSVLISRECSLVKVTEIIQSNLIYPFSVVAGIKMDSRVFASVPERSYDCRLKLIKIPSNYQPLFPNGTDKRYISNSNTYNQDYKIYEHDWNGEFILGWTDNPAWILYDILTSTRYGLGSYLDESQINIWELYKIGRFCDAVNDEGYFIGVSDGINGLEPRFSCNVLFKDSIKIFDAINVISNLFRGVTFFANSELHFIDDRPRTPIAIFSNTNVKDGFFSYSNNRRDQQFNTIEVAYLDRFDNFKTKLEFVEDEADIRKRAVFKTTINTMGVTSRAMARRIGQHIIYQTIRENQGVEFKAGLESLLCRPGDLIIIEDEMKTQQTNFGRVLSKDIAAKSVYIENEFDTGIYNNKITFYSPTGYSTSTELYNISQSSRSRLTNFTLISGGIVSGYLQAKYEFSHYLSGFPAQFDNSNPPERKSTRTEYFAFYTGKNSTNENVFCYYNTGFSGWIFSTGQTFTNNVTYDKLILNTGLATVDDVHSFNFNYHTGFIYDTSVLNKRSNALFSNIFQQIEFDNLSVNNGGILDEEIAAVNNPQVATFDITGYNNSGLYNNNYGSILYLNPNDTSINLLQFVQEGSPYRIERLNSESQIYKILTIREDNQNEYTVVATKYNTGKFIEIENFASNLLPEDTFNTAPIIVNNVIVEELKAPVIQDLKVEEADKEGFSLKLDWGQVPNALSYELIFTNNKETTKSYTVPNAETYYKPIISYYPGGVETPIYYKFKGFGYWTVKIRSVGNGAKTLNSRYSEKSIFVAYLTSADYSSPVILDYAIL